MRIHNNKFSYLLDKIRMYMHTIRQYSKKIRNKTQLYIKSLWDKLQRKIQTVMIKGGLKFKLIGSAFVVILVTIVTLSSIIIYLMKNAIEQKAIEVATTSIERIADFSNHALLERSYENRLSLHEMINEIRLSEIEGVLDISIYEHLKKGQTSSLNYLAGFGYFEKENLLKEEQEFLSSFKNSTFRGVTYDNHPFINGEESINAYRFIKPIYYKFQNKEILLGVAVLYYDKKAITNVVQHVIYIAIIVTIVILLIMGILTYFAGLQFSRPILSIAQAATDVSKGKLNIDLDISSNDEIGELATRFNDMVKGLREKDKMQKFISNSTINMIQGDSKSQLVLGGEYRSLTFLFSDIRGFTAMSEMKKPEEVVSIINFYLNLQSEIIKMYGGDIDKFVGDEIMVSFMGEDSVDKAIQCSVAIQKCIAQENIKRKINQETICHVGIGIHQGEVIVGNIGSHDRMDFTSIGSVVNLASRLCSHALAGQILIEETTCNMAQSHINTQKEAPIVVKGFTSPINISSILIEEV